MVRHDLHEENRRSWNEATRAHNSHKGDQARFFREGGSTLFPEEIELLGDIAGRTLVHLQCNAGQDSLSLARLGAAITGVDISDEAIDFACRLSGESGIPATFHRADVYDWLDETAQGTQRFDFAFSSYGALIWLSDIRAWARGVAGVLAPAGRFVLVEFHPVWYIFDDDWTAKFSYFTRGEPQTFAEGIRDYVALAPDGLVPWGYEEGVTDFQNPYPSHEFPWGLGEVVTALLDAGLTMEALREYPYSNGAALCSGMRELPGRRMVPPAGLPAIPLMYGLVARKAPD
jgi:2-polyprenyl-3-methyl-5-hydroxy-6-metoxy-1,4-benzoquinol methylase